MKRRSIVLGIVSLMILYILITKYWTEEFDRTYDCIQFVIGEENYEEKEVRIKGKVNRSLLKDDYISYTIWIAEERYPKENELLLPYLHPDYLIIRDKVKFEPVKEIQTKLRKTQENYYAEIGYEFWRDMIRPEAKYHNTFRYGAIQFDKNFTNILIRISEKDGSGYSWSSKDGYSILVSQDNIENSKKIIKEIGGFDID